MTEENNISEPFQNNQNPNENELNQKIIDDEDLNNKMNKLKKDIYILMFILIILEILLEYMGTATHEMDSDNDLSGVLFFFFTPFSIFFSIIIVCYTSCDFYPLTKIIIFIIFFIIKEASVILFIFGIRFLLIYKILVIIVTFSFIIIAIFYQILLKKYKKLKY